ncbi:hypothetical protein D3C81_1402680 [compost metagenome]
MTASLDQKRIFVGQTDVLTGEGTDLLLDSFQFLGSLVCRVGQRGCHLHGYTSHLRRIEHCQATVDLLFRSVSGDNVDISGGTAQACSDGMDVVQAVGARIAFVGVVVLGHVVTE